MRRQTAGFGSLTIVGVLLIIFGSLFGMISWDPSTILLLVPGCGFMIAGIIGLFMGERKG